MSTAYLDFTLEAMAYLEQNAHTEETLEMRRGLRSVANFLESMVGREPYKPKKFAVYVDGKPFQYCSLESDAKMWANNFGGEVREV